MDSPALRIGRLRGLLRHPDGLSDAGEPTPGRANAASRREWIRVAQGAYFSRELWQKLWPAERHLVRAIAVDERALRRRPVFSHLTAAAIWGVATYEFVGERVHTLVPESRSVSSNPEVLRHRMVYDSDELTEVGGLCCTSLPRTLLDVARAKNAEQAAVVLDSGLDMLGAARNPAASRGGQGKEIPTESLRSTENSRRDAREQLLAETGRRAGEPGMRRATKRIEHADPRAESVAESLSRLQLRRLGYEVDVQPEVGAPDRGTYRLDFEFLGLGAFGEVDGRVKYLDSGMRGGRSAEEVVLAEKEREDWIRGSTGKRVVRWGYTEAQSARALGERLRAFGLYPRGRARSFG